MIELSIHWHRLPLPILWAMEQRGLHVPCGLHRTGPDEYRLDLLDPDDDDRPRPVSFLLPSPGPRPCRRDLLVSFKPNFTPAVVFDVDPDEIAAALVVLGYDVRPRPLPDRPQLWEAADGLGDPHYVARWARDEEG